MTELTTQDFSTTISQPAVVLVDFWATWCGPCRMLAPVLEQLATEYQGKSVIIAKLNIDDNQEIAQQYNIVSIPTMIIFQNGAEKERLVGLQSKDNLEEKLEKYLT